MTNRNRLATVDLEGLEMVRISAPTETAGKAPSHSRPDVRYLPGIKVARALGWFSIGLGLAELLKPRDLARATGVDDATLVGIYGIREIVCGIGILRSSQPTGWLWARTAGDVLDIATLASASSTSRNRGGAMASLAAVAGVTAVDVMCAMRLSAAAALED
ncbi:MAG: cyclase/dehydrase [Planctomycetaceae bacterium]|nr:cyclase/dehydrase [Planctomycetaceae bacterium]